MKIATANECLCEAGVLLFYKEVFYRIKFCMGCLLDCLFSRHACRSAASSKLSLAKVICAMGVAFRLTNRPYLLQIRSIEGMPKESPNK